MNYSSSGCYLLITTRVSYDLFHFSAVFFSSAILFLSPMQYIGQSFVYNVSLYFVLFSGSYCCYSKPAVIRNHEICCISSPIAV